MNIHTQRAFEVLAIDIKGCQEPHYAVTTDPFEEKWNVEVAFAWCECRPAHFPGQQIILPVGADELIWTANKYYLQGKRQQAVTDKWKDSGLSGEDAEIAAALEGLC